MESNRFSMIPDDYVELTVDLAGSNDVAHDIRSSRKKKLSQFLSPIDVHEWSKKIETDVNTRSEIGEKSVEFSIIIGWFDGRTAGIRIIGTRKDLQRIKESLNRLSSEMPNPTRAFFESAIEAWKNEVSKNPLV